MNNRDIEATWAYHDETKHSLWSVHNDPHYMDFGNQPIPFKLYTDLEPIPLPRDFPSSEMPALSAVSGGSPSVDGVRSLDSATLASIFHHSAGITKRGKYPGMEILFRAAACTGALYHIELYLVCGDLPGLEAGVYHFGVRDFVLTRLRQGDYRDSLLRASGGDASLAEAPAVVVCTGTYWRNSWKYRDRTYRHCFWDTGTILANLLAISTALGVPSSVVAGFVDEPVNLLLGLDTEKEVALCLVPLGHVPGTRVETSPEVPAISLRTQRLSREEVDYPAIRAMHAASSLSGEEETSDWHGRPPPLPLPEPTGRLFPLRPDDGVPEPIEPVIVRRGSTRQFVRHSIAFSQLSNLLAWSTRGIPADFLDTDGTGLNHLYLIVHAVDGLPAGSYVFHRDRDALELLEEGEFRSVAGYLGLQQALPADASIDVFFLVDLHSILARYGNRGYRAVQLEAGIIGGKLYLAANAQRLGATGLTFFDDDVTEFFSPHAQGKSVMFLVALGVPLRKRVARAQ